MLPETKAISTTLAVVVSVVPLTTTCLFELIVQILFAASTICPVDGHAITVSFADIVGGGGVGVLAVAVYVIVLLI